MEGGPGVGVLGSGDDASGRVLRLCMAKGETLCFYSLVSGSVRSSASKVGEQLSRTGAGAVGARDDIVLERERVCAVGDHKVAGLVE